MSEAKKEMPRGIHRKGDDRDIHSCIYDKDKDKDKD